MKTQADLIDEGWTPDPVRFCTECGEVVGPDGWCPSCSDGLIPGDEEEVEG